MPNEVFEEAGACVAVRNAFLSEDLVGELRAGFEGELFGEHERVVTVEEDPLYL